MTTNYRVSVAPGLPPVLLAEVGSGERMGWVAAHHHELTGLLTKYGAVMLRGLDVRDVWIANEVGAGLTTGLMEEREPFAPRLQHLPGLYSYISWPADQPLCVHHELSYALEVPRLLVYCCLAAPTRGGATKLADASAVLRELPPELTERFERHGWELQRVYNGIVGVDWQTAFCSDDRLAIEQYCQENNVRWCWDTGTLHTRRRRPAIVSHPITGESLWFNQISFLNEWTMDPVVREYLIEEFGRDGLPFNTFYGDGSNLDKKTVDLVNDVYTLHTVVCEPWQTGDVLLVDNIRMAHGREPYEGDLQLTVAFGNPIRLTDIGSTWMLT